MAAGVIRPAHPCVWRYGLVTLSSIIPGPGLVFLNMASYGRVMQYDNLRPPFIGISLFVHM